MKAWTDYPILALGDIAGEDAPIREVKIIAWDHDKHATVEIVGTSVIESIKLGYLYSKPGRCWMTRSIGNAAMDKAFPIPST